MSKRRVVVTGIGAVTPIGNCVEEFWEGIQEGRVGIGPITRFDAEGYKAKLAAEVKDFDPKKCMDARQARRMALIHILRFFPCFPLCLKSPLLLSGQGLL